MALVMIIPSLVSFQAKTRIDDGIRDCLLSEKERDFSIIPMNTKNWSIEHELQNFVTGFNNLFGFNEPLGSR
jgi:hypothetical protein